MKINLVVSESQTELTYSRKEKMDWFIVSIMHCHSNAASETTIKSCGIQYEMCFILYVYELGEQVCCYGLDLGNLGWASLCV